MGLDQVTGGQPIATSPAWRAKDDLVQRVQDGGPVVNPTWRADVPELGQLNRKQIALARVMHRRAT